MHVAAAAHCGSILEQRVRMRRRKFIALVGGTAAAWAFAARAQQPTTPVVGFIHQGSPDTYSGEMFAFHQGLSETGFVEGRNVVMEYRWADGKYDQLPAFSADLINRPIGVICAALLPAALAAKPKPQQSNIWRPALLILSGHRRWRSAAMQQRCEASRSMSQAENDGGLGRGSNGCGCLHRLLRRQDRDQPK
jgi:hypothetical protein